MKKLKNTLPHLIQIERGVKIKDCEPKKIEALINYLLPLLSVKAPTNKEESRTFNEQLMAVGLVIKKGFGNYTIEEVKEAFMLALAGKTKVDLYQKLDAMILSRVMKAFIVYKNNQLEQYKREQISKKMEVEKTEEEKKAIRHEFLNNCLYKPYKDLIKGVWSFTEANLSYLYEIMDEQHLIEISKAEKLQYKEEAINILTKRLSSPANNNERLLFKNKLESLNKGSKDWKSIAKGIVAKEYLQGWALAEEDVEKIIK